MDQRAFEKNMNDTELLDMMERTRWIPIPTFRAAPTTMPGEWREVFDGWAMAGLEATYPTLRSALIAMVENQKLTSLE